MYDNTIILQLYLLFSTYLYNIIQGQHFLFPNKVVKYVIQGTQWHNHTSKICVINGKHVKSREIGSWHGNNNSKYFPSTYMLLWFMLLVNYMITLYMIFTKIYIIILSWLILSYAWLIFVTKCSFIKIFVRAKMWRFHVAVSDI